jgi:hypothetical protein
MVGTKRARVEKVIIIRREHSIEQCEVRDLLDSIVCYNIED